MLFFQCSRFSFAVYDWEYNFLLALTLFSRGRLLFLLLECRLFWFLCRRHFLVWGRSHRFVSLRESCQKTVKLLKPSCWLTFFFLLLLIFIFNDWWQFVIGTRRFREFNLPPWRTRFTFRRSGFLFYGRFYSRLCRHYWQGKANVNKRRIVFTKF